MSYETYLELTPGQFRGAYKAFIDKVNSDRQHAENTSWQVARWQVWRTMCPPQQKQISVFDLIKLPGDEQFKTKKPDVNTEKDNKRFSALTDKWK